MRRMGGRRCVLPLLLYSPLTSTNTVTMFSLVMPGLRYCLPVLPTTLPVYPVSSFSSLRIATWHRGPSMGTAAGEAAWVSGSGAAETWAGAGPGAEAAAAGRGAQAAAGAGLSPAARGSSMAVVAPRTCMVSMQTDKMRGPQHSYGTSSHLLACFQQQLPSSDPCHAPMSRECHTSRPLRQSAALGCQSSPRASPLHLSNLHSDTVDGNMGSFLSVEVMGNECPATLCTLGAAHSCAQLHRDLANRGGGGTGATASLRYGWLCCHTACRQKPSITRQGGAAHAVWPYITNVQ